MPDDDRPPQGHSMSSSTRSKEADAKHEDPVPANFERAISSAGYGKFNYLLLLAILPAGFSSIFSSSAISYVLPSAECDLKLTMFDKGLLNSVAFAGGISGRLAIAYYGTLYCRCELDESHKIQRAQVFAHSVHVLAYRGWCKLLLFLRIPSCPAFQFSPSPSTVSLRLIPVDYVSGMICTAFLWGYLTDIFGRRKIMFYGYLVTGLLSLATSFSYTSWILIVCKFFDGMIISGPFAALMSYLAEVHDDTHRSRSYMWLGAFFSLANISLPCVAWLVIPQKWNFAFLSGTIEIHSWRVFLAIVSLPEFLACIAIFLFPESPRFLILKGRHDEALSVLRKIYSLNTGKDPDTYPIKALEDDCSVDSPEESCPRDRFHNCWKQIEPLFLPPNVWKLISVSLIQLGGTIGSNTLRLWMPQLFAMIESYKMISMRDNFDHALVSESSFCHMLGQNKSHRNQTTTDVATECVPSNLNSKVFISSIVIAVTSVIGYILAGSLITLVGKKKLMAICFTVAAVCCGSLYWAEDTESVLGLSSVFIAMSSIGGTTITSIIVDNFPTCLRTMAVSTTMMTGRIGAVMGNLLFPVLFDHSCLGPFIMISSALLISTLLTCALPRKMVHNDVPKDVRMA